VSTEAFINALRTSAQPRIVTPASVAAPKVEAPELAHLQGPDPARSDGGSKKLRTAPSPAAFATANDGWQYTGPLAEKLPQPRCATVNLWAVPGATINIYNPMVLENGRPKLIATAIAPSTSSAPMNAGAYATGSEFSKEHGRFQQRATEGMVSVSVSLPKEADWHVNDVVQVTQKVGERLESLPVAMEFIAYRSGLPANTHAPYAEKDRYCLQGGKLVSTEDYAVPPRAQLQILADGLPCGDAKRADDMGRFEIDLPAASGALELRVANAGGIIKIPVTGTAEPWSVRIARWEKGLREGVLRAPDSNNTIDLALDGLPKGYKLEITNPSNGATPQVFTADDKGHLAIHVTDVCSGDTLSVNGAAMKVADQNGSVRDFELDAVYQVPTAAEQARFEQVFAALSGRPEREMKFALELLGPYSPFEELKAICDASQICSVLEGAKLGSVIGQFSGWGATVKQRVAQHPDPWFQKGFDYGLKYKGDYRAAHKEVGLEMTHAGARRIVITGGYSPISGSHGPLTPETVKDPDSYSLQIPGLQPISLSSGGYGPRGWVNPNAILLTYTRSGASSSWQEG
jgi:hypothetical protein